MMSAPRRQPACCAAAILLDGRNISPVPSAIINLIPQLFLYVSYRTELLQNYLIPYEWTCDEVCCVSMFYLSSLQLA